MSTCGSGELGWCPRSCEARPESIATFGEAACPDAQQIAAVTSRAGTKRSPPVQGDGAPPWPQQALFDESNEHANAGKAAPSRLTPITTTAVSGRSTGNNSKSPAGWTVRADLRSAIPHNKSIVGGVPCRGSRSFEVLISATAHCHASFSPKRRELRLLSQRYLLGMHAMNSPLNTARDKL